MESNGSRRRGASWSWETRSATSGTSTRNGLPDHQLLGRHGDTRGPVIRKIYAVQTNSMIAEHYVLMTTEPARCRSCDRAARVRRPTSPSSGAGGGSQWTLRACRSRLCGGGCSRRRSPPTSSKTPSSGRRAGWSTSAGKNREVGGIVPHVTLKSIANDEAGRGTPARGDAKVTRVSGPFVVEATIPTPGRSTLTARKTRVCPKTRATSTGDRDAAAQPGLGLVRRATSFGTSHPPAAGLTLTAEAALAPDETAGRDRVAGPG